MIEIITAKMAVTLDHVSGGRSYLGLGAGWFEDEAAAHGIQLGTIDERMTRFEEGLEVIVSLLTGTIVTLVASIVPAPIEEQPVEGGVRFRFAATPSRTLEVHFDVQPVRRFSVRGTLRSAADAVTFSQFVYP